MLVTLSAKEVFRPGSHRSWQRGTTYVVRDGRFSGARATCIKDWNGQDAAKLDNNCSQNSPAIVFSRLPNTPTTQSRGRYFRFLFRGSCVRLRRWIRQTDSSIHGSPSRRYSRPRF